MSNSNFKLEGNTPTVTWADPKSTSDNSAAAQVYSDGNCRFMRLNQLLTDSERERF